MNATTSSKDVRYRPNLPGIVIMLLVILLSPHVLLAALIKARSVSTTPYAISGLLFAYLPIFWNAVGMVVPGMFMGKYGWIVIAPYALGTFATIIGFAYLASAAIQPFSVISVHLLVISLECTSLVAFFQASRAPSSALSRSFAPYLPSDVLDTQTLAKGTASYQPNLAGIVLMVAQMILELPILFRFCVLFVAWCSKGLTYEDPALLFWSAYISSSLTFAWGLMTLLFPLMLLGPHARIFIVPYAAAKLVKLVSIFYIAATGASLPLDFGLLVIDCMSISAFLRLRNEPNSSLSRTFAPYLPVVRSQAYLRTV